ncbi:DUF1212-domain-containing protein [Serendipita vermifera]|nr:DUF1212-domain-containing protein [Serendipita vermifera]
MSDRNHVHFAEHDDYNAPTPQSRPPGQSYQYPGSTHRISGSPGGRWAKFSPNSVRFAPSSTTGSPHASSPVIRDPTPYHPWTDSLDNDSEDDGEPDDGGYLRRVETRTSPQTRLPPSVSNYHLQHEAPDYFSQVHFSHSPIEQGDSVLQSPIRPLNLPTRRSWADRDSVSTSETLGVDTIYNDDRVYQDEKYHEFPKLASPPSVHLRQDEYTIRSPGALRPVLKRTPTTVEEGGIRAKRGVFQNLMGLYGLSKRPADPDDLTLSRAVTTATPTGNMVRGRSGYDSMISPDGQVEPRPFDPDHPIFTGVKSNSKGRKNWEEKNPNGGKHITYHIATLVQRQTFILRLAKALMMFGAPSHRIESQLEATATVLEVNAQFIHLPSVIIASFGDPETQTTDTHFVKANGRLALGKLHNVHQVYRQVVHDEISAEEGTVILIKLMKERPLYPLPIRCLIAFCCCALICPLAFGGSFLDMWVAGAGGAILCFLQLHAANKSAMYANVFEISVAILISFIARALSSIPGKLFCYEAISSSGVVLILPGYLILCSALELASKNIVNGSVRMIYAIIYSLFLGFGLTIGSDLYYIMDRQAQRNRVQEATRNISTVTIHGTFTSENSTVIPSFNGSFTFSNGNNTVDNTVLGCYRDASWPWYQQDFPLWSWFLLVPAFSLFSSSWNLQPLKSKQLPAMIVISCCAFAANTAANRYILNRSDVVSAIGAFVVGILGNAYSRIFRGTAFQSMVIGVLFLVPSGIAAAGGLSENYRGQDGDQYTTGLAIGLRMVQVAIGITVGLFGSGLVVYSFGSRKQGGLFAF